MRRRVNLPQKLIGTAFLTEDVPTGVLTPDRMRADDLQRPSRGVRTIELDVTSLAGRCLSYRARMMRGQAFSHTTAALLYGIPLPPWFESESVVHVAVNEIGQPPRVTGVIGHSLAGIESDFRIVDGFTVTDPVSTWCLLSNLLSLYDLVAAGDFLISGKVTDDGREPALATLDELREGVRRYAGRRGAKSLREALERVRTDVDSRTETWTRLILVDGDLPEPVVNEPVFDSSGRRLGKPDLAYPAVKVLFEYDGDEHRVSKKRFRADIERRERFEAAGWRVIRVIPDNLFVNPRAFLNRVRGILAQRHVTET